MYSPELTMKVHEWRQKALAGTMTQEECREALSALRSNRTVSQETSTKAKTRKAKTPISGDDLLSELEGL